MRCRALRTDMRCGATRSRATWPCRLRAPRSAALDRHIGLSLRGQVNGNVGHRPRRANRVASAIWHAPAVHTPGGERADDVISCWSLHLAALAPPRGALADKLVERRSWISIQS